MATPNDTELQPDFVICWLDQNMGVRRNNIPSKIDLANNINLGTVPTNERVDDIDNFIQNVDRNMDDGQLNQLYRDVLKMFTDKHECMEFIDDNLKENKKVFLIVSGQMGDSIVPDIYEKLSGCIYVFCGLRHVHEWTDQYSRHIEVYDDETGVFARVLSDIGIYYLQKGTEETLNQATATQYLEWARRFLIRAGKLDGNRRQGYLDIIDDHLKEQQPLQPNNNKMETTSRDALDD